MDWNAFFERLKNLLLFPSYEWKVISLEKRTFREMFASFGWILILAGAIAQFAGSFFYVRNVLDIDAYRFSFPLVQAIIYLVVQILVIYTGSAFMKAAAGNFKGIRSFDKAARLFAFSYTPVLLMFIVANLHHKLNFLLIFGFYSVWLFLKGSEQLLSIPKARIPAFTFLYIISAIGSVYIFTRLFGLLTSLIFSVPGI